MDEMTASYKKVGEIDLCKKEILNGINLDANVAIDEMGRLRVGVNCFQSLTTIENFVERVRVSEIKPVNILARMKNGRIELTDLEKECFRLTGTMLEEYDKRFEYSEHIKVFFDTFFSFGYEPNVFRRVMEDQPGKCVLLMNQFLMKLKEEVSGSEFKRKLKKRIDGCKRNSKSVREYIHALFDWHARILVVRVDLCYKKLIAREVTDWASHKHLNNLLNNMRSNSLFKDMLGYVWKMEYGLKKGNHFHFAFFFDGSKVQKDVYLANEIGKYWSESILKGQGHFYNCNRDRNKYKHDGIGMVHYDDNEKIEALMNCMDYLTKKDQYFRLKTKIGCRVLGRAVIPKKRMNVGGRPRKKERCIGAPVDDNSQD